MNDRNLRLVAILSAILGAAALRLVPHPPNFTPIGAMALFSGAMLGRKPMALAAPIGALLLSDLILGFYSGMAFQYAATALVAVIGWALLAGRVKPLRVGGAALASAILFFVVTNVGVWMVSGMYPQTAAGLGACFVAALPFFQNSLAGDLLFAAVLFGGFALLERSIPAIRSEARVPA